MKSAYLKVDLDAIRYNYRHITCKYKKKVIAVLKDNAYGLGLLEVASCLKEEANLVIAVNQLDEAILLRNQQFTCPILYLNVFDEEDLQIAEQYQISLVVSNLRQLTMMENKNIPFHLKFETGMHRIGLDRKDAMIAISKINTYRKKFRLEGLMTHLASEDENHEQYHAFEELIQTVKQKDELMIHCHSSSSLTEMKNICNYVRVGIKLYGIGERSSFLHLAVSLYSPVIQIKTIEKNQKVGYSFAYETKEKGYLYLLPLGYGQGWGRFEKSYGYLEYKYLEQAGLISMDYSCYFSTTLFDIHSTIELIGPGVPIESLAQLNHLDVHEILTRLKVKKIYQLTTI